MKHWGKALVGLAVTVLLLWWVLRDTDLVRLWSEIRAGDPVLLATAVALATALFWVRAARWRVLLTPVRRDTPFRSRLSAVSIGFMANNVLWARAGEFARAFALSRLEPVSASAAFGTLVVERLLDAVVLLLMLVLPVLSPGFPSAATFSTGFGALLLRAGGLGIAVVLGAAVSMVVWPKGFVSFAERIASRLPRSVGRRIVDALEAFLGALDLVRSPGLLATAFVWTVGLWLVQAGAFWIGMRAYGIDAGFVAAIFTTGVVAFSVAVPAAPGFFGTFHFGVNFALSSVYGVEAARSLGFAFGYHFGAWIPITLIGFWFAWKLGLSLGDVGGAEEHVEEIIEREHAEASGADAP